MTRIIRPLITEKLQPPINTLKNYNRGLMPYEVTRDHSPQYNMPDLCLLSFKHDLNTLFTPNFLCVQLQAKWNLNVHFQFKLKQLNIMRNQYKITIQMKGQIVHMKIPKRNNPDKPNCRFKNKAFNLEAQTHSRRSTEIMNFQN